MICKNLCTIFSPVQGGWGGCPTGNGKKLAAARHSWARQHAWPLLSFFPFPVGHPMSAGCTGPQC